MIDPEHFVQFADAAPHLTDDDWRDVFERLASRIDAMCDNPHYAQTRHLLVIAALCQDVSFKRKRQHDSLE